MGEKDSEESKTVVESLRSGKWRQILLLSHFLNKDFVFACAGHEVPGMSILVSFFLN